MRTRKYKIENLVPMFLKAAQLRQEMRQLGFTDNGGAIHSAERIIDILGLCLKYPHLTHRNSLKRCEGAECSESALVALQKGLPVHIEHVNPLRAFTIKAIEIAKIEERGADRRVISFVKRNYRLVLLTPTERSSLDRKNRSKMDPDRLAGIKIVKRKRPTRK